MIRGMSRAAVKINEWTERWIPGAFTIAWILTLIVLALALVLARASFLDCARAWGDGFWELLPFSMQMCLVMFTGSIVAVSPPVARILARLASLPKTPRQPRALKEIVWVERSARQPIREAGISIAKPHPLPVGQPAIAAQLTEKSG